jgi:hypothetical protein
MVLVNQPDTTIISASLSDSFIDLSGTSVTEVTLGPSSGQVLRDPTCQLTSAPAPPTNLKVVQ